MSTIRTVVFPLSPTPDQANAMLATTELYTKAWQACVDVAWDMEKPSSVAVHHATYYNLKQALGLKSQLLCSARNRAVEAVKSAQDRIKKKRKTEKPQSFAIPIRLDARTLSFDSERKTVSFTVQSGRIKMPLFWHLQAQRYKDWPCKSGELALNRKGHWVLRLHFEGTKPAVGSTNTVVGIDRGIRFPAVSSNNRFLGEKSWKEHERKLFSLRAKLQSKGTKSAKRKLKKLTGRLRRFRVDCDRVIAKQLISALSPGDTLVLEDLTDIRNRVGKRGQNIKRNRSNIGRWSFRRLEFSLRNLAELSGVQIAKVSPKYTSQTCSRCGVVAKSNRKTQSLYACGCGLNLNADLNAARNIRSLWLKANGLEPGLPVNQPIVAPVEAKGSLSSCGRG